MTHGSLFSGIGGFDLAAKMAGFENIFQVENDEFCQKVLSKNFPETDKHRDIYEFDAKQYSNAIDVISGGFPCQPFSCAGKRKGTKDDRYLWNQMFRVISEIRPSWVIAENVYGLITISDGLVFEKCATDLENIGYEVQSFIIPAISKNAPHRRDRVWIIANNPSIGIVGRDLRSGNETPTRIFKSDDERSETWQSAFGCNTNTANYESLCIQRFNVRPRGMQYRRDCWREHWYEVATALCRVDDGVPRQLDRVKRIKALGNAIVPQVAYEIFKTIKEIK